MKYRIHRSAAFESLFLSCSRPGFHLKFFGFRFSAVSKNFWWFFFKILEWNKYSLSKFSLFSYFLTCCCNYTHTSKHWNLNLPTGSQIFSCPWLLFCLFSDKKYKKIWNLIMEQKNLIFMFISYYILLYFFMMKKKNKKKKWVGDINIRMIIQLVCYIS